MGRKSTIFASFSRAISKHKPPGGLIFERRFTEGFLRYDFEGGGLYLEGLIHGGAYFRNFTVIPKHLVSVTKFKTLFLSVTGFSGPQRVSFSLKA